MNRRTKYAALAVAVGAAVLAGCTTDPPTPTTPLPPAVILTGEFLSHLPPATTVTGTCNPSGTSTFTFTVTGDATGPYAGTFTESGTVTVGPQTEEFIPGQFRGDITSFSSTFDISSPSGTVHGTKSLATGFNKGVCNTNSSAQIIASGLAYSATVTGGTTLADSGTTYDNMNLDATPAVTSSSLQFRSGFTSAG